MTLGLLCHHYHYNLLFVWCLSVFILILFGQALRTSFRLKLFLAVRQVVIAGYHFILERVEPIYVLQN